MFDNLDLKVTDPVFIFAIVMVIILVIPIIAKKIRTPDIVGLILSGTVLGQSVLGVLERDETMILLGTVGLLYLMFMAGLSIDLNQFEKLRSRSIVFGLISFNIPMVLALWIGQSYLGYSLYSALLLGSIVGSHTLLAYPIANKLGITKNNAVIMVMGGTIVTDTVSLIILAVVSGASSGNSDATFWLSFVGSVLLFVLAVMWGLPRIGRWFFKNLRKQSDVEYIFLISILFVTALLAGRVGLAPIIGAFLAGLTLNRLVPENSTLMSRIQFVGNVYFIPFFLISVGLMVDVKVLISSLEIWIVALVYLGLVVVGKGSASFISAFIYKHSLDEALVISGLSIPQAAATLAVTLVGYDLGLLNDTAVNAVVVLILISCLIGPSLVQNFGRKLALKESQKPYNPKEAPQRILIPLANPDTADNLLDLAMMIRSKRSEEPLYPLVVARDGADVEAQVANSEAMLGHAVIHASAADVPVQPITRVDMSIVDGIIRANKELRVSNIIIGWNGQSDATTTIFGTILDQLLEQTEQMLMVCKFETPINTIERVVLVAPPYVDREPGFSEAIETLKNLTIQLGAALKVVTTKESIEILKEAFGKSDPTIDAEYVLLNNWNDLNEISILKLEENDLPILLSARSGSISWNALLQSIPQSITKVHKNFVAIYPTEDDVEELTTVIRFNKDIGLPMVYMPELGIDMTVSDAESAIKNLMMTLMKDDPAELDRVSETLLSTKADNKSDFEGYFINHASSRLVNRAQIVLGTTKKPVYFENLKRDAKVLLLIIYPPRTRIQDVYAILGNLSKLIKINNVSKTLLSTPSIDDLKELFTELAHSIQDK